MRRFYAESTASELAWNDCPEFGHLRLCNHSPDIPLVRRCDPHTPSYIKSGYQRSRASLPTAAALLVSSPNLEHGVPGGQESAPDLPSGLRYLSPSLPGVRGRPPSSPATPVRPHEPPAHPRARPARHTSPRNQYPGAPLSPRPHQYRLTSTRPRPRRRFDAFTEPASTCPLFSVRPLARSVSGSSNQGLYRQPVNHRNRTMESRHRDQAANPIQANGLTVWAGRQARSGRTA